LLPLLGKTERIRNIRVPYRLRRIDPVLYLAITQARYSASFCSVDLNRQQVVPVDAHSPRGVGLHNDVALKQEGRICGIIRRAFVPLPWLVDSAWNMRGRITRHRFDFAE